MYMYTHTHTITHSIDFWSLFPQGCPASFSPFSCHGMSILRSRVKWGSMDLCFVIFRCENDTPQSLCFGGITNEI